MAQDTQKQVDAERAGEVKRGPGRPKGSRNKGVANNAIVKPTGDDELSSSSMSEETSELALDELSERVEFGFEELHRQFSELQETIRVLGITLGQRPGGDSASVEVLAELKRLSATEQRKCEQLDQWTRVLVAVSGADRRRYWRIMRAVYRFARHDKARDVARRRKKKPIVWWRLCLLAAVLVLAFYGGLRFLA